MYNSHDKLPSSATGGTVIMTKGRKTTFEERVEIASYCITHDHNYAETAIRDDLERYYGNRFTAKAESIIMIENHIEYYNNKRLQRNLGVLTPMEKH
jgi:hypothetical protein